MKILRLNAFFVLVFMPLAFLAHTTAATPSATDPAANSKTNSVGVSTNAASALLPVPLSIFDLAAKPARDPFFPLSLRQPVPVLSTNASPAFTAAAFNLKGLSGSADRRLALLNNRTVAAGESAEITTPSGKIKIRCVEIRESSVIIRAESQPDLIEIYLRKSAQ